MRQVYEHFSDRGELAVHLASADFEFDVSEVMPDMAGKHGLEAAERLFRSYAGMFVDFEIRLQEVIAAEGDHVVTAVVDGGHLRGSDAEVHNQFFHVFTIRDGRVVRWSSHTDRQHALKAARLSE